MDFANDRETTIPLNARPDLNNAAENIDLIHMIDFARTRRQEGVTWRTARSRWQAQIRVNGKPRYLASFQNEEEAARCYDAAALEAFGEFAYTNAMMGLLSESKE